MAAHMKFKPTSLIFRNLFIMFGLCVFIKMTTAENLFSSKYNCDTPLCVSVQLEGHSQEVSVKASEHERDKKLCVFCYQGQEKKWHHLWINPKIILVGSNNSHWDIYYGNNISQVVEYSDSPKLIDWMSVSTLRREHSFQPFNASCIGVLSSESYTVHFTVKNPEIWYVTYTVIGLLIFFFAPSWSRNTFFHYSTGVSVGILGSVLIALFIVNKLLPQKLKMMSYVITAVSASASMWLIQYFSVYLHDILLNYWQVLVGYVGVAGLLSFAVVYRYGPVTNPRSLDLVKWSLQILGLALVYQGTQISEMSVAIIIGAVLIYHFPVGTLRWLSKISCRYRYFPPKTRLLTSEEFYKEGELETRKALVELKKHCQSPDCNAWKTLSRLNSPGRFASFMEGDSHVSDGELEDYDHAAEMIPLDVEDDSSGSELNFRMNTR